MNDKKFCLWMADRWIDDAGRARIDQHLAVVRDLREATDRLHAAIVARNTEGAS